jgi:hypothetical protein
MRDQRVADSTPSNYRQTEENARGRTGEPVLAVKKSKNE